MRFRTKEEFEAWYERNDDKIQEFQRKADKNTHLYHEVVYTNGKETYYYRGNPSEKSRNPRKAVWHVIGNRTRELSSKFPWTKLIPFTSNQEVFESDKIYLITDEEVSIRSGKFSNPEEFMSASSHPILIYVLPQTNGVEEKSIWAIYPSIHTFNVPPISYKQIPDWATAFLEYPLEEIRPILNYPRGEFHG